MAPRGAPYSPLVPAEFSFNGRVQQVTLRLRRARTRFEIEVMQGMKVIWTFGPDHLERLSGEMAAEGLRFDGKALRAAGRAT